MVFHEITRMPTPEHDDKQVLKKKHVGNDAVVCLCVFHIMLVAYFSRSLFVCLFVCLKHLR